MVRYAHIVVTVLFLLYTFITPSFAQYDDLEFEHISPADGLPDDLVRDIFQDYLGFIWIGTTNGLVKYDGFRTSCHPHQYTSLTTSFVIGKNKCKSG